MVGSMLERINLVPRKPMAGKIRSYTPLVLIVLVTVISLAIYMRHNSLKNEIADSRRQLAGMQAGLDGYNALKSIINSKKLEAEKLTEVAAKSKSAARRMEVMQFSKNNFSLLIEKISKAQPDSVLCRIIRLNGNSCAINGIAKGYNDLPAFIERLKDDILFSQVSLGQVLRKNRDNNEIIFEFNITAQVNQAR